MIVIEYHSTRKDGVELYKTFSDLDMMIEREGILYEVAIDPKDSGRVYTETDIPIENLEEDENPEIIEKTEEEETHEVY
jgi:hypothetical protein